MIGIIVKSLKVAELVCIDPGGDCTDEIRAIGDFLSLCDLSAFDNVVLPVPDSKVVRMAGLCIAVTGKSGTRRISRLLQPMQ